jgi:hypothetical protein
MAAQSKGRTVPNTDLALLWLKAVNAHNDEIGKDKANRPKLSVEGISLVKNISEIYDVVDTSSKSFKKWRHPDGSKVDKVRTIIGDNLGKVQWVGDQVVSAGEAAFPPAGAIWTVVTYAIKACQKMSRDYDQLLVLIGVNFWCSRR